MIRVKKGQAKEIGVVPVKIQQGQTTFHILGVTPLIYNAMSQKTVFELLKPKGRKTTAEKATTLKHIPIEEYRASVYRRRTDEVGPTRLLLPSRMFKAALAGVAKRVPGSTTAEMKQLCWAEGTYVDLYGTPQIFMCPVRNSDIARTPDIRTRAIVRNWYCKIVINYTKPQLSAEAVGTLLSAAGILNGVGDFRQEKGAGNFGQFEIVNGDDARIKALLKEGLKAQDEGLRVPTSFDVETETMLTWFDSEMSKRDEAPVSEAAE